MSRFRNVTLLACTALLVVSAPIVARGAADSGTVTPAAASREATVLDRARLAGTFGTLLGAIERAGLTDALEGEGPFTVLAPTDDAFAKLPAAELGRLLDPSNVEALAEVLKLHVIPARVTAAKAANSWNAETLSGRRVAFRIEGGRLRAGAATVTANDIQAKNGIVHVIDTVLLPPTRPAKVSFKASWSHPVNERGVKADVIELSTTGGGGGTLSDVEAEELVIRASGGSRATVTGRVNKLTIRVSGGSRVNTDGLEANEVTVRASGGSTTTVRAVDVLDVNASGSSRVTYVDTGVTVRKHVSSYSRVQARADEPAAHASEAGETH